jgi:hypothetical protein
VKNALYVLSVVSFIVTLVCFFVFTLNAETAKQRRHNTQQVLECKELGGFARTDADGWLIDCTFPR